jgi:hypothetical protein
MPQFVVIWLIIIGTRGIYHLGKWLLLKLKGKPYLRNFLILLTGLVIGACGVVAFAPFPELSNIFNGATGKSSSWNERAKLNNSTSISSVNTQAQPSTTIKPDPAMKIKDNFIFFEDSRFPSLNNKVEYSKAVGDLARIQDKMLKDRGQASNFPQILIGNGKYTGKCDSGKESLGVYTFGNGCNTILINFASDGIAYEYPIEVLTTLAHEYAHHLANVTIGIDSSSGLENELLADCFAGLLHGYWDKYGKVSKQEVIAAAEMMIQVSTKDHMDTSAMHGSPGQRLGAFMGGAQKAQGINTVEYTNFCKSLDRIIDWNQGLP